MKILFIRLSSLGDVALTIPAINMLKDAHPDWQLDFLTHKPYVKLLKSVSGLNNIFCVDKKGLGKLKKKSVLDAMELIKDIHNEDFDAVVDYHSYPETGLLASLTNSPLTIGCGPASPLLYDKHYGNYLKKDQPIWQTHAETLVNAKLLDKSYLERTHEFFYLSQDDEFAQKIDDWFKTNNIDEASYKIGMFLSASRDYKCWDNSSYLQFVSEIASNFEKLSVIVLGSLNDEEQRNQFLAESETFLNDNKELATKVKFHWYPSPELIEIVEIDRKLDFFISNDTGPYHLAVFSGVQTIGLYQKALIQFSPPKPHLIIPAPDEDLKKLKSNVVSEAFNKLYKK